MTLNMSYRHSNEVIVETGTGKDWPGLITEELWKEGREKCGATPETHRMTVQMSADLNGKVRLSAVFERIDDRNFRCASCYNYSVCNNKDDCYCRHYKSCDECPFAAYSDETRKNICTKF